MGEQVEDHIPFIYTRIARFVSAWWAATRDARTRIPETDGEITPFGRRNSYITYVRILARIARDAVGIANAASRAAVAQRAVVRHLGRETQAIKEATEQTDKAARAPGEHQHRLGWKLRLGLWVVAPIVDYGVLVTALQAYIADVVELNVVSLSVGIVLTIGFYAIGRLFLAPLVEGWRKIDGQWVAALAGFLVGLFVAVKLLLAVANVRTQGLGQTNHAAELGQLFVYLQALSFTLTLAVGYVDALTDGRTRALKSAARARRSAAHHAERAAHAADSLESAQALLAVAIRQAKVHVERERAEGRVIDHRYAEQSAAKRRREHDENVVPEPADDVEIPPELLAFDVDFGDQTGTHEPRFLFGLRPPDDDAPGEEEAR